MENELLMQPVRLSQICGNFECRLIGDNIQVSKFGNLSSRTTHSEKQLTYVISKKHLIEFNNTSIAACIIHRSLAEYCSPTKSYLVTEHDAEMLFYSIFMDFVEKSAFDSVNTEIGTNNIISKTAVIHDSVRMGSDCIIMDNVVLMPNTIIGDRVTIKPNTVIGGDGFQVKNINGKRKVIPHQGGVRIYNDVEIGSNVTIDKGLFGEFTTIESEVKVDNLVQISHSIYVSERTLIAAGSIIAGGVFIGKNVWVGIKSSINQLINIGDYSYIGAGTTVIRSIKPQEKVVGVPSRRIGFLCTCQSNLEQLDGSKWKCGKCGTRYQVDVIKEELVLDNDW